MDAINKLEYLARAGALPFGEGAVRTFEEMKRTLDCYALDIRTNYHDRRGPATITQVVVQEVDSATGTDIVDVALVAHYFRLLLVEGGNVKDALPEFGRRYGSNVRLIKALEHLPGPTTEQANHISDFLKSFYETKV